MLGSSGTSQRKDGSAREGGSVDGRSGGPSLSKVGQRSERANTDYGSITPAYYRLLSGRKASRSRAARKAATSFSKWPWATPDTDECTCNTSRTLVTTAAGRVSVL